MPSSENSPEELLRDKLLKDFSSTQVDQFYEELESAEMYGKVPKGDPKVVDAVTKVLEIRHKTIEDESKANQHEDICQVNEDDEYINCTRQQEHFKKGDVLVRFTEAKDEKMAWVNVENLPEFKKQHPDLEVYLTQVDKMVHGQCILKNPDFFKIVEHQDYADWYPEHGRTLYVTNPDWDQNNEEVAYVEKVNGEETFCESCETFKPVFKLTNDTPNSHNSANGTCEECLRKEYAGNVKTKEEMESAKN